jgi:hypothetical protein
MGLNKNLITHIQIKIKSLKDEIKAIQYTINHDVISVDSDFEKINECAHKIQVLNEIIISFGVQK